MARSPSVALLLAGLGAFAATGIARAQVEAHFVASQISNGCNTDADAPFGGDPDRYPSAAVFDSNSAAIFNACINGCTADSNPATLDGTRIHSCTFSTGCGVFNFNDLHVAKIIPNNTGAYFYFGLWDDDNDPDDSLGDHWFSTAVPTSGTVSNNNLSPYYADHPIATVCADVEGIGDSSNFTLTYSAWFVDQSGPSAPSNVQVVDDGIAVFWDNDTTLNFSWSPGFDPHSGIDAHHFSMWSDALGGYLFQDQPAFSTSASVCPAGCNWSFTAAHGNTYWVLARALNGANPTLNNQSPAFSNFLQFGVDLVNPTSTITAPPASGWYSTNLSVAVTDTDSGSGLSTCERQVVSGGIITAPWATRPCNTAFAVTVGAGAQCQHPGADTCRVDVRSTDLARRVSSVVMRIFDIDFQADAIQSIAGFTHLGGTPISAGSWVSDNTPAFQVVPGAAVSPLSGYSWTLGAAPDCVAEAAAANPLELELGAQPEGSLTFRIRTIDAAGNCGPEASYALSIDTETELITSLAAHADGGSPQLFDGVWHDEAAVEMSWTSEGSTAPLSYSTDLSGAADCVADLASTTLDLNLPEGMTPFAVRAVDAAGNCGDPLTFNLAVDTQPDPIQSVAGFTAPGGTPIPPGSWVADNTPAVQVTPGPATSPLSGYSWTLGAPPDCVVDVLAANPLDIQLATQPDGLSTFYVRAIDDAGNCGLPATFTFSIDTEAEAITSIAAHGVGGVPQIFDGVWHNESTVEMSWTAEGSTAPLSFSSDVSGEADCVADGADPFVDLTALPEGMTTFRVRPVDAAGNCGEPVTFNLAVDTEPDTISGLAVLTERGGTPIAAADWTSDNDPFVSWTSASSTSPIAGYNVAIDRAPSCAPQIAGTSYQFPGERISNGMHVLQVVAIDEAGNCGPPAEFDLWVDAPLGAGPGHITDQLLLSRNAVPGDLDLSWGASCGVANTYSIHEGELGSWYSHVPLTCSTSGALSATITPGEGDRYYLVVPAILSLEGSYGLDSDGDERPPSTQACLPQAPPEPCP